MALRLLSAGRRGALEEDRGATSPQTTSLCLVIPTAGSADPLFAQRIVRQPAYRGRPYRARGTTPNPCPGRCDLSQALWRKQRKGSGGKIPQSDYQVGEIMSRSHVVRL